MAEQQPIPQQPYRRIEILGPPPSRIVAPFEQKLIGNTSNDIEELVARADSQAIQTLLTPPDLAENPSPARLARTRRQRSTWRYLKGSLPVLNHLEQLIAELEAGLVPILELSGVDRNRMVIPEWRIWIADDQNIVRDRNILRRFTPRTPILNTEFPENTDFMMLRLRL